LHKFDCCSNIRIVASPISARSLKNEKSHCLWVKWICGLVPSTRVVEQYRLRTGHRRAARRDLNISHPKLKTWIGDYGRSVRESRGITRDGSREGAWRLCEDKRCVHEHTSNILLRNGRTASGNR
jgi:hypothetical protein